MEIATDGVVANSISRGREYHAFISYSHAQDRRVASALQRALERFGVPFYVFGAASLDGPQLPLRPLRVFRDKTNLAASPDLWSSIEAGLASAEWFILLASPTSASSPWVRREVEWWIANRSADRMLIAWTDGRLRWGTNDFDWEATDALPNVLAGAFSREPLWIDLRAFPIRASRRASTP